MLHKDVQRAIGFLAEMGAVSMGFWAQGPVTQGLLGKKGGVDIVCLALALQTCVPKKKLCFFPFYILVMCPDVWYNYARFKKGAFM